MRIVHLVAGAGPMYCGSCMHGNTLAAALVAAGADVLLAPLYTPLRTDEEDVSIDRLAFGGINVYLQDRWPLFRHTPWFLDRLLDRPGLVRWAARRGARTRPERLGRLTISVLRGEEGRQRKELEKLIRWLRDDVRPDLVHLSNALLAGVARAVREHLNVPVICTLSGEDAFLEKLPPPYRDEALAVLRQQAAGIAAFTAMNHYYAGFMADYLAVPRERIHVIPPGLNLAGHKKRGQNYLSPLPAGFSIGYLSRICPEKGLHLLVEALRLLVDDPALPPVRVRAAGYLDEADRPYLEEIRNRADQCGVADRFDYAGELDRSGKIAFLQSLDVLCLPTLHAESKGLPALEAWANGVPAVLPAHGAFPEMVEDTGGGLLFEPGNVASLVAALRRMILEPELAARCGRQAQQAVYERYHAARMARQTMELYEKVLGGH